MGWLWDCVRWRTINGNRVCVKKGFTPAAGVLVVGAALALGAGGAGAATSLGTGSASSSAAKGTNAKPKARGGGVQGVRQLLQKARLDAEIKESKSATDCAANSYGQVREFFRQHPCRAMARGLIEVRDGPVAALIAVAIVDMPDERGALALKRLVDQPGTGNVDELGDHRFTGRFYASWSEGTTVGNAQAEPVGRVASAVALAELAAQTLR